MTVEERRARALERLDAAQLALMPAAAAGNSTAAHALAKLIAQEAALVPSMAAPVMGGGLVQIKIDWLEKSGRLSYADQDEVAGETVPALTSQNGPVLSAPEPLAEHWRAVSPTSLSAARRAGRESVEKLPELW